MLRACPLADAKAACFVKRPRDPGGLRARGGPIRNREPSGSRNRTGGTPDFGPGPVRRKARLRPARRYRRGRSFGFLFAGQDRGFGPGSCETRQGPRISVHGLVRRNRSFGFGSCRTRDQRLRPAEPPRREQGLRFQIRRTANRRGFGPDGEPPGKPDWASAPSGLRRMRGRGFGSGYRSSKPPGADARASRLGLTQRDSGGRQRCRPPLLFWGCVRASHALRGSSDRQVRTSAGVPVHPRGATL